MSVVLYSLMTHVALYNLLALDFLLLLQRVVVGSEQELGQITCKSSTFNMPQF